MKRKAANRRGQIVGNKIVLIIIALVVLAAVLMFIFKAQISEKIQNLPGYGPQEDKEIDYSKLTPEQKAALDYVVVGSLVYTPRLVARNYAEIHISGKDVNNDKFYWYYGSGNIELNDDYGNERVGSVGNCKVSEGRTEGVCAIFIESKWIDDLSLRAKHPLIPSIEGLKKINGAKIVNTRIRKDKTSTTTK